MNSIEFDALDDKMVEEGRVPSENSWVVCSKFREMKAHTSKSDKEIILKLACLFPCINIVHDLRPIYVFH